MAVYLLIVVLLNCINAMFSGKSKVIFIMTQVILIIMFAYMSIYTTPQDSVIYQGYYMHPEWETVSSFERGFVQLMSCARWMGLNYLQFRLMIAIIGYSLIAISLFKLRVKNKALFYFYYILMPFVEDPIQLRNFLMTTIVLFGFTFLVKEKFSGILTYIIIVLLSATIQSLGLLFLLIVPFYVVKDIEKLRNMYLTVSIVMGLTFAVPFSRQIFSSILGSIAQHFGTVGQKIATFLFRAQPGLIIFADILVTIIILYLLNYIGKILPRKTGDQADRLVNLGINMVYTLFATMPLYFFAYNFDRMIKDSLFLFFIIFAFTIPKITQVNSKRGILVSGIVICTILGYSVSYYSYGTGGRWNPVVYPVIFDNQFGKEFSDYD